MNRLDTKMDQALQLLTTLTRSQSELDTNHKEHKQQWDTEHNCLKLLGNSNLYNYAHFFTKLA